MSLQIGYIDSNGHPRIKIRVHGPDASNFREEDALIDTGFTGFLMLPQTKAFALGMVPSGTSDYTLADESLVTNYISTAVVTVGHRLPPPVPLPSLVGPTVNLFVAPESVTGVVVLCGDGALVGMEFVRALNKYLVVGSVVVLIDNEHVTNALNTAQTALEQAVQQQQLAQTQNP